MKERQLIFMDFEFSMPEGKNSPRNFYPEIIEAGIVLIRNGNIEKQFSSYVKPMAFPKLTQRCKKFLHIKQENVDDGMPFHELVNYLKEINDGTSQNKIITWGNMDIKVLRNNCQQAKLSYPLQGEYVDLSMEYKRFFGDRNQTGLWKAVEEYGKDGIGKHHKALDDALTTYHIYKLVEKDKQYLQKASPPTIGDRVDLSKLYNLLA
ncbi:3'-5' exonuclease KapD [Bacillus spongiae]|uniref:3'-5' exonuclease KapD n=1 Tax=Bacillus spongiae TaxID=2683610 RepID=A0ABU8HF78_9BACI